MKRSQDFSPALTMAGSDCSGGAGVEADLKTFAAHGVYGMAAITAVVAENPRGVVSIHRVPARRVREQIACCLEDMPSVAVKTGMLLSASISNACRSEISNVEFQISNFVVDPVMVATSGALLLEKNAICALRNLIASHADLVTPNLDEAEILAECKIRTASQMEIAAVRINRRFDCAVLLKGGHFHDPRWASDFFCDGSQGRWLRAARIRGVKTHGTGCTYSAAITANLARGHSMLEAIRRAKRFTTAAIRHAHRFGPWMALDHVCAMPIY